MTQSYVIERMTASDMAYAVQWAADAGWNPGLHDKYCFYQTDPNGFFIGKLGGMPIAIGSAVIYDAQFAFCGFYIVDPMYRGKGYGLALTKARLAYVGTRNAGIDGVLDMLDKYARLGYQIAHHNARYELDTQLFVDAVPEHQIVDACSVPFDVLLKYDSHHFPAMRARFLKCWIHQEASFAHAVIGAGRVCGYGVIRPATDGFRIGPLFAENEAIATSLLISLVQRVKNGPVYLDCPLNNPHAMILVKRYDLKQVFETARMYLKGAPDIAMDKVYGITTFELG
ncbi:MAG: GNAT family N-acetyltransferase [Legionellaceae bacterium]|nr:GNAT family N-acetyltransferase [Legionellaceae bacterium]